MSRVNYRHAGPRRRSWWRGPALPLILLGLMIPVLIIEIVWMVS